MTITWTRRESKLFSLIINPFPTVLTSSYVSQFGVLHNLYLVDYQLSTYFTSYLFKIEKWNWPHSMAVESCQSFISRELLFLPFFEVCRLFSTNQCLIKDLKLCSCFPKWWVDSLWSYQNPRVTHNSENPNAISPIVNTQLRHSGQDSAKMIGVRPKSNEETEHYLNFVKTK